MYQPYFPLELSDKQGAYLSITDIKDTIKQNILFLLSVNPGEWPMNPELGVGINRFLFENYSVEAFEKLKQKIKFEFEKYMPFLVIDSEIQDKDQFGQKLIDYNAVKLIIYYSVPSLSIQDTIKLDIFEKAQQITQG